MFVLLLSCNMFVLLLIKVLSLLVECFYRIFTLSCVCVAFIFSLECLYSLIRVDTNIKAGSLLAFVDKDRRSLLTSAPNIIFW